MRPPPPPPPHAADADRIHGDNEQQLCVQDFRPVKAVGNGDMGTVFLVLHKSTNTPYAMKVMKKETLISKKAIVRAQTERNILTSLQQQQHPFLPSLFTSFESEKHSFLVMDYCTGGDLNVLRQRQSEKIFSVSTARFYAAEVILAVEYLHKRGIVYRDLKPENVLVQADGHIMLTDFDVSLRLSEREHFVKEEVRLVPEKKKQQRSASLQIKSLFVCGAAAEGCYGKLRAPKKGDNSIPSRVTPVAEARNPQKGGETEPRSNSFVGTVEYLAPEVVLGSGHSWQVDWWTLGIFLYEMVYGKTPFRSENGGRKEIFYNIITKDPEIPGPMSPLKDLLQKLLKKDPTQRLGTNGVDEIKNHPFFSGVQWDSLQFICRPPYVPPQLMVAEIDAEEVERYNLARSARHAHAEKSAGQVEQEQMQRETFGDLSTYRKVVLTQNLQDGADPDTSQCQEEQTPLAAMPDLESGPDLHVSTQKQSEESEPNMITSSQSWSGSEFVKSWTEDSISRSGKFWMQFDGHKQISSSKQENRSVVNGMNQVLMQMKRDHPESIKMIEYF